MTAPIALLPCPFCGHEAEIERLGDRRQSTIYRCTDCSCTLETGEEWGHGRRWNERAGPTRENGGLHEAGIIEAGISAVKDWDKPATRDLVVDIVEAVLKSLAEQGIKT